MVCQVWEFYVPLEHHSSIIIESSIVGVVDADFRHTHGSGPETNSLTQKITSNCSAAVRLELWKLLSQISESYVTLLASISRYYGFATTLCQSNSVTQLIVTELKNGNEKSQLLSLLELPVLREADSQYQRIIDYLRKKSYESHSCLKKVCDLLVRLIGDLSRPVENNRVDSLKCDSKLLPDAQSAPMNSLSRSDVTFCGWTLSLDTLFHSSPDDFVVLTKSNKKWTILTRSGDILFMDQPYSEHVRAYSIY